MEPRTAGRQTSGVPPPRLTPYDANAPRRYAVEANRVVAAIRDTVAAEHVGSTAVPGLAGKPTIDIAVGVETLALQPDDFGRMALLGYSYGGTHGRAQHVFRKGGNVPWEFLVHVVEHGGPMWRDFLLFRDHLRVNPHDARAYAALKVSLLSGGHEWYSGRDKAPFIEPILARER